MFVLCYGQFLCLLFFSLSSSLQMEEVTIPFPVNMEVSFIQEDLKPGGEALILGTHIIGEGGVGHWNALAGSTTESGFANGDTQVTRFNNPKSFFQLDVTNVVIADTDNNCLRLLTRSSQVMTTTFSGECESSGETNGPKEAARFMNPHYLARDLKPPNALIVLDANDADNETHIRWVDIHGMATQKFTFSLLFRYFTQSPSTYILFATTLDNQIYGIRYDEWQPLFLSGETAGGFQELAFENGNIALFQSPKQLLHIGDDTLLVADEGNNRLRMVDLQEMKSDSICNGGDQSLSSADHDSCNIESPISLYIGKCGDVFAASKYRKMYVIRGKLPHLIPLSHSKLIPRRRKYF